MAEDSFYVFVLVNRPVVVRSLGVWFSARDAVYVARQVRERLGLPAVVGGPYYGDVINARLRASQAAHDRRFCR